MPDTDSFIPCRICYEEVNIDRVEVLSHIQNKHQTCHNFRCLHCGHGTSTIELARLHRNQVHDPAEQNSIIDNATEVESETRAFVNACFPTVARSIEVSKAYIRCSQCHQSIRNLRDMLNDHMLEHVHYCFMEIHPFGQGAATREQYLRDLRCLFLGQEGQLNYLILIEQCFPNSIEAMSPALPRRIQNARAVNENRRDDEDEIVDVDGPWGDDNDEDSQSEGNRIEVDSSSDDEADSSSDDEAEDENMVVNEDADDEEDNEDDEEDNEEDIAEHIEEHEEEEEDDNEIIFNNQNGDETDISDVSDLEVCYTSDDDDMGEDYSNSESEEIDVE